MGRYIHVLAHTQKLTHYQVKGAVLPPPSVQLKVKLGRRSKGEFM